MIKYRLEENVVAHFPAIFKGLGSKPSVIHMALDVELEAGALVVRVAGGRPIECGKCSRSTIVELARELIARKHRVVLVEEACGFGYAFHRRDAGKLLDQLYDFDVNRHKKALRPIRVPTLQEQKSRRLCRMRSQLIKVRNILEGQGRGLMFDFQFS
jgi:transposase